MVSYELLRHQLFDACKNGGPENLDQLFAQPDIAATILHTESAVEAALRPRRDFVLYVSETNLHRMLVLTCEVQDPHKVESLLRFGLQHNVPAVSLSRRALSTLHACLSTSPSVDNDIQSRE
jgi:hypothetical protein